jgi:hypothetical protein
VVVVVVEQKQPTLMELVEVELLQMVLALEVVPDRVEVEVRPMLWQEMATVVVGGVVVMELVLKEAMEEQEELQDQHLPVELVVLEVTQPTTGLVVVVVEKYMGITI